MRIAIISDIHYGESEQYGKINPETKLNTRLEDIDTAFNLFIDYVLDPNNLIDIVILGGDFYKARKPTPTQQLLLSKSLVRFINYNKENPEKPLNVIIFTGNHDVQRNELAHSISTIATLIDSQSLWIEDKPRNYYFEAGEEKVLICTIPFLYRQKLEMGSNQQVVDFYGSLLKQALEEYSGATCKVMAGHQTIEGCSITEYSDMNSFNEPIIPIDLFNGFDFVSQGHIHTYQILKTENPLIVHQGNPTQLEFDNVSNKGFIVYDTQLKKHLRVPIIGPNFLRLDFDGTEDENVNETIKQKIIASGDLSTSIVKIRVKTREKQVILDKEIKELVKEAKFFAGIEKEVIPSGTRIRSTSVKKGESLEVILTAVAKSRDYTPEKTAEYVAAGLALQIGDSQ